VEEIFKTEIIEIGKTEKRALEKKEEITLEEIIETLIKMGIIKQEITVTTEVSKIEIGIIKVAQEIFKAEIIEIGKTEKRALEKKEEITLEEIIGTLIKMEIIRQETVVITEVFKIETEITKVVEETLEIDRIIEDFLIEVDLIRTEMTLEKTAETFLMPKRKHHLKFQQRQ